MPRTLKDGGRDELEAVIQVVRDAIIEHGPEQYYTAAYGALSIAGSLGMFCHCTKEHEYLQPLFEAAVLEIEVAAARFIIPQCKHT